MSGPESCPLSLAPETTCQVVFFSPPHFSSPAPSPGYREPRGRRTNLLNIALMTFGAFTGSSNPLRKVGLLEKWAFLTFPPKPCSILHWCPPSNPLPPHKNRLICNAPPSAVNLFLIKCMYINIRHALCFNGKNAIRVQWEWPPINFLELKKIWRIAPST